MNAAADLLSQLKRREFKPLYLLHGEEPYYIDRISNYMEKSLLTDAEKGFNQSIFYGRETDVMTVLNAAKRFPMMSEYQLVMVKEAQDFKWGREGDDAKAADPLLAYLENPLRSTILVFCYKHGKFDKRKKAYKAIEKQGCVFESPSVYDSKISSWVEDFVKDKGYRINARASALISEYLGNDLSRIANELEKLMLNVRKGNEISAEDIHDNIGISKEYNVFELQSAIASRDVLKANRIVNYFADNPRSNPIQMVLGTLNSYFMKILKYHYVADKSSQSLARELGVSPYFVKEYELAGRNYDVDKVFNVIGYLREYDLKTKGVDATGNTEDGELMKELVFKIVH